MMKIQLEQIGIDKSNSFRLMHDPKLNDLFYWHFHPEYELVYIEGSEGTRHVGDHISTFYHSDLVLIGSNIPHLNFDYGMKDEYLKEVLHINPNFISRILPEFSELALIKALFDRSKYGIAFGETIKKEVAELLKGLYKLSPFRRLLTILQLLESLAHSTDYILLHDTPVANKYNQKQQSRLRNIYAFVDDNYHRKISVSEVAELCHLEKATFCRFFKKATGNTFINFLNQYRVSQAKRLILSGKNVTESCYASGFESLSYFNRIFKKIAKEKPSGFRQRILK